MDFKALTDSLLALENANDALLSADQMKVKNDAKAAAALAEKAQSDQSDLDAATAVNSALDSFGSLVADFVAKSKVTR